MAKKLQELYNNLAQERKNNYEIQLLWAMDEGETIRHILFDTIARG